MGLAVREYILHRKFIRNDEIFEAFASEGHGVGTVVVASHLNGKSRAALDSEHFVGGSVNALAVVNLAEAGDTVVNFEVRLAETDKVFNALVTGFEVEIVGEECTRSSEEVHSYPAVGVGRNFRCLFKEHGSFEAV